MPHFNFFLIVNQQVFREIQQRELENLLREIADDILLEAHLRAERKRAEESSREVIELTLTKVFSRNSNNLMMGRCQVLEQVQPI